MIKTLDSLIALFRGGRVVLHLLYGMLLALPYPHLVRERRQRLLQNWSRELLSILNIRIRLGGHRRPRAAIGGMLVSNHVSWLDIFVLNAIQPAHFIAKSEVRVWPVIGWLCVRSGTIFVSRERPRDAIRANREAAALLREGACVGLFPEGTTTDGSQVGHFHPALMQAAFEADVMLCPLALRYLDANGQASPHAAFTGDTSLLQSLWRILCCRRLDVSVVFAPALPASGHDRRSVAGATQRAVADALRCSTPQPVRLTTRHPRLSPLLHPLAPDPLLPLSR